MMHPCLDYMNAANTKLCQRGEEPSQLRKVAFMCVNTLCESNWHLSVLNGTQEI